MNSLFGVGVDVSSRSESQEKVEAWLSDVFGNALGLSDFARDDDFFAAAW